MVCRLLVLLTRTSYSLVLFLVRTSCSLVLFIVTTSYFLVLFIVRTNYSLVLFIVTTGYSLILFIVRTHYSLVLFLVSRCTIIVAPMINGTAGHAAVAHYERWCKKFSSPTILSISPYGTQGRITPWFY